jgi:hypothetical protein
VRRAAKTPEGLPVYRCNARQTHYFVFQRRGDTRSQSIAHIGGQVRNRRTIHPAPLKNKKSMYDNARFYKRATPTGNLCKKHCFKIRFSADEG